jgi:molybdate transport system substrate-binding protein
MYYNETMIGKALYNVTIALIVAILSMSLWMGGCSSAAPPKNSLTVYCGAGLSKALSEIGTAFENRQGITINFNFAGSNTLLSQLQLVKTGDIYIPGSSYYLDIAVAKALIRSHRTIAFHIPVIAVQKGNPKLIFSLQHLAAHNIRLAVGDPKAAAIGKTAVEIFLKNHLEKPIFENIISQTATVNELIVFLSLKQVDAAIVWEDNARAAADKIDIVSIPDHQNIIKTIPAGILNVSNNQKSAQLFIDFLLSPPARNILKKYGFRPYDKKQHSI